MKVKGIRKNNTTFELNVNKLYKLKKNSIDNRYGQYYHRFKI